MIANLLAVLLVAGSPAKPKMVVLELAPAGGVQPEVASALTESVSAEMARTGYFEVLAKKDIDTILGLERQRQMLGCSETTSCMAELAGALGARFVMTGSVAKLGEAYQLSLQVIDTQKAQPVGRTTRMAKDLAVIRGQIPLAVAEAAGTPPPPPPSHLLPYSMIGAGALLLVGGGLVGMDALAHERSIRDELANGEQNAGTLQPLPAYQKAGAEIGTEKTVALVMVVAAAGLIGGGLYLNPFSDVQGSVGVALVPGGAGVSLAGTFR